MATTIRKAVQTAFAKACAASEGFITACAALAREALNGRKGLEAYNDARNIIRACAQSSEHGNAHTVLRYATESAAILAADAKADVPTAAVERTEKAQKARKRLGVPRVGGKPDKSAKADKSATPVTVAPVDGEAWYRMKLATAAGRTLLITMARTHGYAMMLSPVGTVDGVVNITPEPKASKANGKAKPVGNAAKRKARKPSAVLVG